jgi:pimeloyl-ACP methyl ester carboxylesterase
MTTQQFDGIFVEVQGEASNEAPFLCIHGLGGTTNTWTPVLAAFGDRRVVRVDLPGSARSPLPDTPLSIEGYVTAVLTVLDGLGIAKTHVVAHSMGTIVAQHLAVEHPDRVVSLSLFGPLAAPPDPARIATRARATLARQGVEGMQEIADAVAKGATSAETKAQRPITLAMIRESLMRQLPEGYAQSCEALANAEAAPVEEVSVPTLLVTGDEDGVGTPAGVKTLGERFAHADVSVLTGCGHWATLEKPVECIEALKAFHSL